MTEELNFLKIDDVIELDDDDLREVAEAGALPALGLLVVLLELGCWVVLILSYRATSRFRPTCVVHHFELALAHLFFLRHFKLWIIWISR